MSRCWLVMAGVIVGLSGAAFGQVDLERFERQLEQIQRDTRMRIDNAIPADQRALIDYGGYTTLNFLTLDDPVKDNHVLRQYDLNGYARANFDGVHEMFLRVRTSYRDFNTGDSFDGSGDDWVEPTLDRGTYRFDLQRAFAAYQGETIKSNIVVQAGRQLVHWANGLVLSEDIDGGIVTLSHGPLALEILAGVTRPSVTDFDSSRPHFDARTHRGFYGGLLSAQLSAEHRPYLYGLVQDDENRDEVLFTDLGAGAFPTRFRYNSYYIGGGSNGALSDRITYGAEIVYEGGDSFSNSFDSVSGAGVTQTRDDISAAAADFRLDYLFTDANRSRLSAELILASGDTDRLTTTNTFGGNKPGTTDTAFNAFGLLNTGLAFAPNVSNILVARGGASTFPLPTNRFLSRMQVGLDLLYFNKLNAHAPIDEKTSDGGCLGAETDLYANWQITSDVSLAVRYGIFFPGDAMPSEHCRNFFYTGLTFAF